MSFHIFGKCKSQDSEEIDDAETLVEAEELKAEYQLAFGADWHIWWVWMWE